MNIVMDLEPSFQHKKNKDKAFMFYRGNIAKDLLTKITLGKDSSNFASLLKIVSKQRSQLHDIIKKTIICIEYAKHCDAIKGLILPLDEIRKLLSNYNSNVQKIKCYETQIYRFKKWSAVVALWMLAVIAIDSLINLIVGAIFLSRHGFTSIANKILSRIIQRIITTDLGVIGAVNRPVRRWVVEENVTDSVVHPETNTLWGFIYEPHYTAIMATMFALVSIFSLILLMLLLSSLIGETRSDRTFSGINILTTDKECMLYKKFFDLLHEKRGNPQASTANMPKENSAKESLNEMQKLGIPDPEKHAIYSSDLFIHNVQIVALFMRLKLWAKSTG